MEPSSPPDSLCPRDPLPDRDRCIPARRVHPTLSPLKRELSELNLRDDSHKVEGEAHYVGRVAMLFVAKLSNRARCFRQKGVVFPLLQMLRDSLAKHGCTTYAFCFLGGEFHVLISGITDNANPRAAFLEFQDNARKWLLENGLPAWQPGVFCRPVLDIAASQKTAIEVLSAPVKKALAPRLCQYPFVGSLEVSTES